MTEELTKIRLGSSLEMTQATESPTLSASELELTNEEAGRSSIRLSTVPSSGLAGFDITVELEGPAPIATIESGTYQTSFGLVEEATVNNDGRSIRFTAADVNNGVSGGESDYPLCSVRIRAENPGTNAVTIRINELTDDSGAPIDADVSQGAVRVDVDKGTKTDTSTAPNDPSPTPPTSTPTSSGGALEGATQIGSFGIEDERYYVFNDLQNEPDGTYAYTDSDLNLVEPDRAVDIAVSHVFAEDYYFPGQERLEYTNEQYREADSIEDMASAADLLAELAGAIAMVKLDPVGSINYAVDAVQTGLDWGNNQLNDPYRSQFARMATTCNTLRWADEQVPNPSDSFLSLTSDAIEIGQNLVDMADTINNRQSLAKNANTVRSVISQTDSITTNVPDGQINGVADLRSKGYTALAGIATDTVVGAATNVAEKQAKTGALLKGNAGARRPLIHEMLRLENRLREGRLGPSGIIRLRSLRQTDYQMEAAALYATAKYQEQLSNGLFGGAYDVLFNTERLAEGFSDAAKTWEDLSHFVMAGTGMEIQRGLQRFENSLNEAEFGDQGVFKQ